MSESPDKLSQKPDLEISLDELAELPKAEPIRRKNRPEKGRGNGNPKVIPSSGRRNKPEIQAQCQEQFAGLKENLEIIVDELFQKASSGDEFYTLAIAKIADIETIGAQAANLQGKFDKDSDKSDLSNFIITVSKLVDFINVITQPNENKGAKTPEETTSQIRQGLLALFDWLVVNTGEAPVSVAPVPEVFRGQPRTKADILAMIDQIPEGEGIVLGDGEFGERSRTKVQVKRIVEGVFKKFDTQEFKSKPPAEQVKEVGALLGQYGLKRLLIRDILTVLDASGVVATPKRLKEITRPPVAPVVSVGLVPGTEKISALINPELKDMPREWKDLAKSLESARYGSEITASLIVFLDLNKEKDSKILEPIRKILELIKSKPDFNVSFNDATTEVRLKVLNDLFVSAFKLFKTLPVSVEKKEPHIELSVSAPWQAIAHILVQEKTAKGFLEKLRDHYTSVLSKETNRAIEATCYSVELQRLEQASDFERNFNSRDQNGRIDGVNAMFADIDKAIAKEKRKKIVTPPPSPSPISPLPPKSSAKAPTSPQTLNPVNIMAEVEAAKLAAEVAAAAARNATATTAAPGATPPVLGANVGAPPAQSSQPALTPEQRREFDTLLTNQSFLTFFAQYPDNLELVQANNLVEIKRRSQAFSAIEPVATELFNTANAEIRHAFVVGFAGNDATIAKAKEAELLAFCTREALDTTSGGIDLLLELRQKFDQREQLKVAIEASKVELKKLLGTRDLATVRTEFQNGFEENNRGLEMVQAAAETTKFFGGFGALQGLKVSFAKIWYKDTALVEEMYRKEQEKIETEFNQRRISAELDGGKGNAAMFEVSKNAELAKLEVRKQKELAEAKVNEERMKREELRRDARVFVKRHGLAKIGILSEIFNPFDDKSGHKAVLAAIEDISKTVDTYKQGLDKITALEKVINDAHTQFGTINQYVFQHTPEVVAMVDFMQKQVADTLTNTDPNKTMAELQASLDYAVLLQERVAAGSGTIDPLAALGSAQNIDQVKTALHGAIMTRIGESLLKLINTQPASGDLTKLEGEIDKVVGKGKLGMITDASEKKKILTTVFADVLARITGTPTEIANKKLALAILLARKGIVIPKP